VGRGLPEEARSSRLRSVLEGASTLGGSLALFEDERDGQVDLVLDDAVLDQLEERIGTALETLVKGIPEGVFKVSRESDRSMMNTSCLHRPLVASDGYRHG
jgi:hypothetical protein